MMMVPMMIPGDSVAQIANGFPAAHQLATAPGGVPQSQFTPLAPWMTGAVSGAMAGAAQATPMMANMGFTPGAATPATMPGFAMAPPPAPSDLHAALGAPTPAPGADGCPAPGAPDPAQNPPAGPGTGGNLAHCA